MKPVLLEKNLYPSLTHFLFICTICWSFNYQSTFRMLMYLTDNTRPEYAFAVNMCAQYSINLKSPHAETVRQGASTVA